MDILKATDFENRSQLDNHIIVTYGKDLESKPAKIQGTTRELEKLNLSHNKTVWGVLAEATDFVVENIDRPQRGKLFDTKLNGKLTIKHKNATKNKSSSK